MKAIVCDKSNKPDVMVMRELEKPVPTEDEVLVKVHACSINAADYRSVRYGIKARNNVYGADVAGVVEAAGRNITRLKVGDRVFGDILSAGFGGFAEYTTAPEKLLARIPDAVSYTQAASLPISGITALQGLRDYKKLDSGSKVLIVGASGGVGTFAMQIAKLFGAEITAVCGPNNVELIRSLGATRVVDFSQEDFTQLKERFDLLLAVHGSQSVGTYRKLLKADGYLVMAGGALAQLFSMMATNWLYTGSRKKMILLNAKPNVEDLGILAQWVAEGKLKPVIDRVVPLSETPQAFTYMNAGHARGKVIVQIVKD